MDEGGGEREVHSKITAHVSVLEFLNIFFISPKLTALLLQCKCHWRQLGCMVRDLKWVGMLDLKFYDSDFKFYFDHRLGHSQLVCVLPVVILHLFGGEWLMKYEVRCKYTGQKQN